MASSARAVYVVNIDGEQRRIPVENPYVQMHKIIKDIKTRFKLDYDFDLTYKGSKILDTSSLDENCFDDHTPLVVVRKDVEYTRHESLDGEHRNLVRSNSLPRQISRPMAVHKVLSLEQLYEEEIEDETELHSKRSTISNEGFQWKPTIIYISPAPSVNDEQINLSFQTSLSSPPFSQVVQPTDCTNSLTTTNNRSPSRPQATVKLSVQRNSSLTNADMKDKVDSIENLSETGNSNYRILYV